MLYDTLIDTDNILCLTLGRSEEIPAGHDARSEFMSFLDILKLQSRLKIITISGVFHCVFYSDDRG